MISVKGFPKDFIWGTATASYQIEGAPTEGGKGRSIWDDFTEIPGKIYDGSDGLTACDHFHRFREDVALMAQMGVKNYRFSVSWPRVMPNGTGEVSEEGLQFYADLVDCLIENGIRPFLTIYHWDMPSALHERGGWLNPDMPEWFAAYTRVLARALGDRVKDFFTINEPQCILGLGYGNGEHAPGLRCGNRDIVRMAHHLLLSHGRAVQVLREEIPGVRVGYAPCGDAAIPASDDPRDIEAARKAYFAVHEGQWFNVAWYSDPALLGCYPEDGLALYEKYLPKGWQEDLKTICQPLDYYAQNIYNGAVWRADADGNPERVPLPVGYPRTAIGWSIQPKALYWGPRFLCERYKTPFIITENGMSNIDAVSLDGQVHDPARIDYTHRYLLNLRKAAEDGMPIVGYFHWSFMDNFEWARGYTERFGLVYVDYATQQRIPKDSCQWYKTVMETNGENL